MRSTILCLALAVPALAQGTLPPDSPVRRTCVACHQQSRDGRFPTLQSVRTTPANWRLIVTRMERNYKLKLSETDRERTIRELSELQALSPDEFHRSQTSPIPQPVVRTCGGCHSHEVFLSQRRTPEAWVRLKDMHLGTWPTLYISHRDIDWGREAAKAVQHLAGLLPYTVKEWDRKALPEPEYRIAGKTWTGTATLTRKADGYSVHREVRKSDGSTEKTEETGSWFAGYLLQLGDKRYYRTAQSPDLIGRDERWISLKIPRIYRAEPQAFVSAPGPQKIWVWLTGDVPKVRPGGRVLKVLAREPDGCSSR